MRPAVLLLALLPATALAQTSPGDVAYCNRLADLYERYIGRNEFSPNRSFGRSSLEGDVASTQCRQGRPEQAIPVLERVLRGNGFTLPPHG
jgi:hypothetical protein